MLVSESVSFKVWNNNEISDFTVAKWIEGSSSYQVDGISVASTIETNNMITELNASERVFESNQRIRTTWMISHSKEQFYSTYTMMVKLRKIN